MRQSELRLSRAVPPPVFLRLDVGVVWWRILRCASPLRFRARAGED